jgi:hypothetical protein
MSIVPASEQLRQIRYALLSEQHTEGSTHGFYLYPARFSPEIARSVITAFSEEADYVLDPFMGGGTAIVEGVALGRSMIGVDLNALAHFVARTRTTPLSSIDHQQLRQWARRTARSALRYEGSLPRVKNLPPTISRFLSNALERVKDLATSRQRAFARCVLLRLGQVSLDCREAAPRRALLAARLGELTERMLVGLRTFEQQCADRGIRKDRILTQRLLLHRSSVCLEQERRIRHLRGRIQLVFTSPPYPRVHVLYHRWQVHGRRETPAPYWIAQVPDGFHASHYTGGSRSPTGERRYYSMIESAFSSVRQLLRPDALVVQLVGFAEIESQLPMYLAAMNKAGYERCFISGLHARALTRAVPNRRWYAKLQGAVDASTELLLFHRPQLTP